jgi:hypothetical protein
MVGMSEEMDDSRSWNKARQLDAQGRSQGWKTRSQET